VVLKNSVSTVKLAKTLGLPIGHSTVNVSSGRSKPTAPSSRTCDVLAAVRAAGRRKLVLCALWIEMCIACKCFFSERIQQNFSSSL